MIRARFDRYTLLPCHKELPNGELGSSEAQMRCRLHFP